MMLNVVFRGVRIIMVFYKTEKEIPTLIRVRKAKRSRGAEARAQSVDLVRRSRVGNM